MFVSSRRFEAVQDDHLAQIRELQNKYCELERMHWRLLAHLGLYETTLPEQTVLRSKGGPEPGP